MARAWTDCGANPASQHGPGRKARRMLEEAREGIAELLGAKTGGMDADRVIFTSGGTEANNLAILGLSGRPGDLVITSTFEHPSITQAAKELYRKRWKVDHLRFAQNGSIDVHTISLFLQGPESARLSSVMLANNETGVVLAVSKLLGKPVGGQTIVHTDAVQAIGKIPVNFGSLQVDAMTVAPHKFHGPLGIGALVLRHGVTLQSQLFGGFQQEGLRPGTENVALAVGFHKALEFAVQELPERASRMQSLRDELERLLSEVFPDLIIVSKDAHRPCRLPNTSCISFPGVDRQALVMALDMAGVACSTGSACASGSSEPSPTLIAMGLPQEVVAGAIRLSLGAFTTAAEVAEAARRIIKAVNHLRSRKSG
jgi:cysteine desulfurase